MGVHCWTRSRRSKSYQCQADQITSAVLLLLGRGSANQTKRHWFSRRCAYQYFLQRCPQDHGRLFGLSRHSLSSTATNGHMLLFMFVSPPSSTTTHIPLHFLRGTPLLRFTTSTKIASLVHFSGEPEMGSHPQYGLDLHKCCTETKSNSSRIRA